jgi:Flp pilus assembly protein TadG
MTLGNETTMHPALSPVPSGHARRSGSRARRFLAALFFREEHGGAMVEFAFTVPVLLLVVTGVYTFGMTINSYMMLINADDVGARQLAVSRGQTGDPCATVAATVYASAPTLNKSNLTFTFVLNGTTYTGTTCTAGAANLVQSSSAEVQLTYPCSLRVYGTNLVPNCSMKATTTELVQ